MGKKKFFFFLTIFSKLYFAHIEGKSVTSFSDLPVKQTFQESSSENSVSKFDMMKISP